MFVHGDNGAPRCLPPLLLLLSCVLVALAADVQPASSVRVRGDMQQLSQELHKLEGKGYKAYRLACGGQSEEGAGAHQCSKVWAHAELLQQT